MYVALPFFVFMEAMGSWLIKGENTPYVWNPCYLLHFTVLWAKVSLRPSFARNPIMPLCFICFSFCVAIHLMDHMDVIASCMRIREPMSLVQPLYRDLLGMVSYVHNGTHSPSVHGL